MAKYLVTGTMMVPFPFEMKVEAGDAVEAESKAVKEQRFILKDFHNLETNERPIDVTVQEIEDEDKQTNQTESY